MGIGGLTPWPGRFIPGTLCTGDWFDPRAIWSGAENLAPTGIRSSDRPAGSVSLRRLSYPGPQQENNIKDK